MTEPDWNNAPPPPPQACSEVYFALHNFYCDVTESFALCWDRKNRQWVASSDHPRRLRIEPDYQTRPKPEIRVEKDLRSRFTENAEQFDALMTEMLAENKRLTDSAELLANALDAILGWRELRSTNEVPIERIEEICSLALQTLEGET